MRAEVRRALLPIPVLLSVAAGSDCSSSAPGGVAPASSTDAGSSDVMAVESAAPAALEGGAVSAPSDGGAPHLANDASFDGRSDASVPVDPAAERLQTRADQALSTLMLNFWSSISANTSTYDWMYAHYWDAVLDATERRGPNAFTGTARMFYELQQKRGWLDGFYDDEDWVTLALLHAYKVTKDVTYLNQAKVVFADIMRAWDTTCCGGHPGGLWWKKPTTNKATAINAGAVISASRLYEDTQDSTYLAFANKAFDYWSTYVVNATSGHVYDSINNAGAINTTWSFTYNEGLFIGAVIELAHVTGDKSKMALAHTVAGYMMSKEIETTALGTIMSDGNCSGDGDMFKGVGARYLGELYTADTSHTEYRDFLQRSGDAAWNVARDPASGDISCDWAGPYDSATGVVGSLGSAAVGLAAAAEALGPGDQRPYLLYEAEEGDLRGIGVEGTHAGFSGWGYLSGWGANGQSVDLLVTVPSDGQFKLTWRYAAQADATRTLSVNGQAVDANIRFAGTGAYTNYATIAGSASLKKGSNTITVAFASAQGSTGYLNLDSVQLTPP